MDLHGSIVPGEEYMPAEPEGDDYFTDNFRGPKRASGGAREGYPMSRTEDETHFLYWVWKSPQQTGREDGEWNYLDRTRKPGR